jgi:hypothetical protein
MNLLPKEYDFTGIEIPCAYAIQSRIRERIEALEGAADPAVKAGVEELALLDLSLDRHISKTVKEQEQAAALRRKAKEEKRNKPGDPVTPG